MPPPDDRSALRDIEYACELIRSFTRDFTEERFLADRLLTSAAERQLGIIGEAVKRLSGDFRSGHPELDWRGWAGLRDILVHAYDDVDLEQIWRVVHVELDDFARSITVLLSELDSSST